MKIEFPVQLEIFAPKDDSLNLGSGQHIIPITDQSGYGLSAILIEDGYYDLIVSRKIIKNGLSLVDVECMIALKTRAYNDLIDRKTLGEAVDISDIKKHRNDIFKNDSTSAHGFQLPIKRSV